MNELLIYAFGTIAGIPIIAVFLILTTRNVNKNSLAFLLAWFGTVFLMTMLAVYLGSHYFGVERKGEAHSILRFVFTIILGYLAISQFVNRKKQDSSKVLDKIESASVSESVFLGFSLNLFNPVNIIMISAATSYILLYPVNKISYSLIFSVSSTVILAVPYIFSLIFPRLFGKIKDIIINFLKKYLWLVNFIILILVSYAVFKGFR